MMVYLNNEKITIECIDDQDFINCSNQGIITKEGDLFITGRIKELIITAGENIASLMIEDKIKEFLNIASIVTVIGEQRKFLFELITLKVDPQGIILSDAKIYFDAINKDLKFADDCLKMR